jgi:hypothetical protein
LSESSLVIIDVFDKTTHLLIIYPNIIHFIKYNHYARAHIFEELERLGGEIDWEEFAEYISLNYRIDIKTQSKYIKEMKKAGTIEKSNGKIKLPKKNN